jgi:hypothetical protein
LKGVEVRTLFLGSYGFGNLGDELCLIDAVHRFNTAEAWAYSVDPNFTRDMTGVVRFIGNRDDIRKILPDRIVLGGGGVGFWPSIRDSLHWMHDGLLSNDRVDLRVYNIGIGKITEPEWVADKVVQTVIGRLTAFSVRDPISMWLAKEWGFGVRPTVTYFPEVEVTETPFNLPNLGERRRIGFSITGQKKMREAIDMNRDRIRAFLGELGTFNAVPIVSTVHKTNPEEDDIAGFEYFADMFLKADQIVFQETLSREWWRNQMTPRRLKYLISQLDLLVSQRKHNIIHAIGTRRRFVGMFPDVDDSVARIWFTLRHLIEPMSTMLPLVTGRYGKR